MMSFLIRPIHLNDLEQFITIALAASAGLTTLPKDPALLEKKIHASMRAFESDSEAIVDHFLFVMEDLEKKTIVGTSGLVSHVGIEEPFYVLRMERERHRSESVGIESDLRILKPMSVRNGPSEMCTLFLMPDYRKGKLGRLLSISRFLFIGAFPNRFDTEVIAEMRGVVDSDGYSPFFQHVGRHFFNMDFQTADMFTAMNRFFIKELMPRYPIYVDVLPREAQDVIKQPHPNTVAALRMLDREGFRISDDVDIFDAGPKVSVQRDKIRAIKESRVGSIAKILSDPIEAETMIISNESLDFKACLGELSLTDNGEICIHQSTAKALNIDLGSKVRFTSPYPNKTI